MALCDLALKKAYHKPEDDIASAFYLPAVAAATHYDRAVGFFSSSIYLLAWPSLKQFVAAGGRMRLICSPVLSDQDHASLREGYSDRADAEAAERIREDFARLRASPALAKPARVLASLVALGVIDCKLAWIGEAAGGRPRRLFHDKVGLLRDADSEIAFKGSMNETWPGLSLDGNLESVDVFVSWGGKREQERIDDERTYFDRLWDNDWPGVVTLPLPASAHADIISAADAGRWPELVDEICMELEQASRWSPEADQPGGRVPRAHQVKALDAWVEVGRRGIFEHATASGKTFTAICAANDAFGRDEIPLFLVPSELLFHQWKGELQKVFGPKGLQLLLCGAGYSDWKRNALLRSWTQPSIVPGPPRAVLATLQTASSAAFLDLCEDGEHLFLVADEVHRLGAEGARRIFTLDSGPRLGLSATPERAGDSDGTSAILDYFCGVVPPPFGIAEAVKSGALTPYAYSVHPIFLDADEQERWQKLTDEYRRLYARADSNGDIGDPGVAARLKMLLIRRARIVKAARGKIDTAARVLHSHYQPGQRWIVYCDDQVQLGVVKQALNAAGLNDVYEYHSAMAGDRGRTLDRFSTLGGIIISIRCLDEGVDIPAVSHALILASSRNPREFIQRRGRVLRRAEGKTLAFLHDVIVAPHTSDEGDGNSILAGEIARAIEFGGHAINPASVTDLKLLAHSVGLDWEAASGGFEVDDGSDDSADTNEKECS
ncbi:DNArepair protein CDS [Bradyrhizobium sp.]|uniref:DEAD/DEAH box helicase family protein n=1 Tax=Bradyrhizobium sp. TaxID=376 RepID=UPI0007C1768D|nr:DEAD/DEAH box helicase family protein [Bradyrhizobium sp.]CUU14219.1 DNArepair protein CDS [Bradyrhizobium sp.]